MARFSCAQLWQPPHDLSNEIPGAVAGAINGTGPMPMGYLVVSD
jgi:hypothetical protein